MSTHVVVDDADDGDVAVVDGDDGVVVVVVVDCFVLKALKALKVLFLDRRSIPTLSQSFF